MSYWSERQESMYIAGERQVNQYFSKLETAFNQTSSELQKTVEYFYFRYAEENGLSYVTAQKRLNAVEMGDLKNFVNLSMQNIGKYNQEVNNLSIKARITRYQALEAQVDATLRQLYAIQYEHQAALTMQEVYKESYYRTWYNIDQYRGYHSAFAQFDPRTVEGLLEYPFNGANFSNRIWKQKDHLQTQLMESLTTMMVQGKNPQAIAGDFSKKMNSKKFDAYRLLQTESSFLMSEATHAGYKEDGVEKYQILSTLDSKTCGICGDLDGQVFEVDKAVAGKNMPPFHCFCRCTDVPYYDDDPFNETRVARDPETGKSYDVPADMTYIEWYNQNVKNHPDMMLKETMWKNQHGDKKRYEKYRQIFGNDMPESFEKFQNMKYNDTIAYENLKVKYQNGKKVKSFKENLVNGQANLSVKKQKQQEHIQGSKKWKERLKSDMAQKGTAPDMFNKKIDVEELVGKYAGTGVIEYRKGQQYPVEYITVDEVIGKSFNLGTGKYENTKRFAIRYSSKGVHLHPVKEV